jgi:ubiquinone/menaquinone biosynthesis C-methylase UbiE
MSSANSNKVCPVEWAGILDFKFRRFLQNPRKILTPYVREGMTALDLGCGPGFFSIEMAKMVGASGKVVAADLQQGMLDKLQAKIRDTVLEQTITLHKCRQDKIGLSMQFDFIFIFYVLHEIPDQAGLFQELKTMLKPDGEILIIEPSFHVSAKDFNSSINALLNAGFAIAQRPGSLLNRSVAIRKPA